MAAGKLEFAEIRVTQLAAETMDTAAGNMAIFSELINIQCPQRIIML